MKYKTGLHAVPVMLCGHNMYSVTRQAERMLRVGIIELVRPKGNLYVASV